MSDEDPDEWISLYDLIRGADPKTPSAIAAAIERHGIQGWRFGTPRLYRKENPEFHAALKALQAFFDHDDPTSLPGIDLDDGSGPYYQFGWQREKLPNFAKAETAQRAKKGRRSQQEQRADEATLVLIGVMRLLLIQGEEDADDIGQPPYTTLQELTDVIDSFRRKHHLLSNGLSKNTVATKLRQARDSLHLAMKEAREGSEE